MNKSIRNRFLKRELLRSPILLLIFLILFLFVSKGPFTYLFGIGCILDLFPTYYRYKKKAEYIEQLKKKGLTVDDIANIEFVRKWDETRKYGLWRYCIRDGGIITGAGLSLAFSLLFAIIFPNRFKSILSEPGDMFKFIGYAYLAGIVIGITLFRILWPFKEKRFARLTDPLNTIFTSKKVSFDELI